MTNDILIAGAIICVFLVLGTVLPFVNAEYGVDESGSYDADAFNDELGQEAELSTSVSAVEVLFSIAKMFFWTFGALHWALDLVFVFFRIILIMTLSRNIWVGGGG